MEHKVLKTKFNCIAKNESTLSLKSFIHSIILSFYICHRLVNFRF